MNNEARRRLERVAQRVRPGGRDHDPDIDRRISQLLEELDRNHPGEGARVIAEMSGNVPQ